MKANTGMKVNIIKYQKPLKNSRKIYKDTKHIGQQESRTGNMNEGMQVLKKQC